MVSAKDLRRMAGKLRTHGADQDEAIRLTLNEMADRYEVEAEVLDASAAEATSITKLFNRRR
jgi:hypothetical protein